MTDIASQSSLSNKIHFSAFPPGEYSSLQSKNQQAGHEGGVNVRIVDTERGG